MLVDTLGDFVFENGNLSVRGGVDATRNTIDFIYNNAEKIDETIILRDCHPSGFHITLSCWWEKDGYSPRAFTEIDETWTPRFYPEWSRFYLKELAATGQPKLRIWWEHCVEGTPGANLPAELGEAVTWLRAARDVKVITLFKGMNPKIEQFGFLPCVYEVGDPMLAYQKSILDHVMDLCGAGKKVFVAGLAEDICVDTTLSQMIKTEGEMGNVYLLQDCTSPVLEKDRGNNFERYRAAGMHIIKSTD